MAITSSFYELELGDSSPKDSILKEEEEEENTLEIEESFGDFDNAETTKHEEPNANQPNSDQSNEQQSNEQQPAKTEQEELDDLDEFEEFEEFGEAADDGFDDFEAAPKPFIKEATNEFIPEENNDFKVIINS